MPLWQIIKTGGLHMEYNKILYKLIRIGSNIIFNKSSETFLFLCFLFFLLIFAPYTFAQNYDERINALLSEVDASDIQYNITKISNETASTLSIYQIGSLGILPFRDENNRRTGLTEYISAEFGKKLKLKQTIEVIPSDQLAKILKNQINLASLQWPSECGYVAGLLNVESLIRGRLIEGANEIGLTIEIYGVDKNNIIGTYKTSLPLTSGLSRLSKLVIDESKFEKPEIQPPPTISTPTVTTALEIAIRNLAVKLVAHLDETTKSRVGVLEFLDLQGRISQLGKFMAEDLTTAFFEKGKFSMVERGLLQQVLREHALTQTGIIDVTQAQEIGKAVGADAIITGSLSDIGNEIKANARLINVKTGTLMAVAGESIAKTENVFKMFNTILWTPGSKVSPMPTPSKTIPSIPSGYLFFEDFQNIQEGMLPEGWIDGEKLMVKSDGRQKFVTNFEKARSHRFTIDNIQFSENFELEYMFRFGRDAHHTRQICSIGDVKLTIDVFGWYQMNETQFRKKQDFRNRTVKVLLRKSGPLFKLFINGEEMIMGRYPEFKTPQALTFEFQNMNGFRLYSIALKQSKK